MGGTAITQATNSSDVNDSYSYKSKEAKNERHNVIAGSLRSVKSSTQYPLTLSATDVSAGTRGEINKKPEITIKLRAPDSRVSVHDEGGKANKFGTLDLGNGITANVPCMYVGDDSVSYMRVKKGDVETYARTLSAGEIKGLVQSNSVVDAGFTASDKGIHIPGKESSEGKLIPWKDVLVWQPDTNNDTFGDSEVTGRVMLFVRETVTGGTDLQLKTSIGTTLIDCGKPILQKTFDAKSTNLHEVIDSLGYEFGPAVEVLHDISGNVRMSLLGKSDYEMTKFNTGSMFDNQTGKAVDHIARSRIGGTQIQHRADKEFRLHMKTLCRGWSKEKIKGWSDAEKLRCAVIQDVIKMGHVERITLEDLQKYLPVIMEKGNKQFSQYINAAYNGTAQYRDLMTITDGVNPQLCRDFFADSQLATAERVTQDKRSEKIKGYISNLRETLSRHEAQDKKNRHSNKKVIKDLRKEIAFLTNELAKTKGSLLGSVEHTLQSQFEKACVHDGVSQQGLDAIRALRDEKIVSLQTQTDKHARESERQQIAWLDGKLKSVEEEYYVRLSPRNKIIFLQQESASAWNKYVECVKTAEIADKAEASTAKELARKYYQQALTKESQLKFLLSSIEEWASTKGSGFSYDAEKNHTITAIYNDALGAKLDERPEHLKSIKSRQDPVESFPRGSTKSEKKAIEKQRKAVDQQRARVSLFLLRLDKVKTVVTPATEMEVYLDGSNSEPIIIRDIDHLASIRDSSRDSHTKDRLTKIINEQRKALHNRGIISSKFSDEGVFVKKQYTQDNGLEVEATYFYSFQSKGYFDENKTVYRPVSGAGDLKIPGVNDKIDTILNCSYQREKRTLSATAHYDTIARLDRDVPDQKGILAHAKNVIEKNEYSYSRSMTASELKRFQQTINGEYDDFSKNIVSKNISLQKYFIGDIVLNNSYENGIDKRLIDILPLYEKPDEAKVGEVLDKLAKNKLLFKDEKNIAKFIKELKEINGLFTEGERPKVNNNNLYLSSVVLPADTSDRETVKCIYFKQPISIPLDSLLIARKYPAPTMMDNDREKTEFADIIADGNIVMSQFKVRAQDAEGNVIIPLESIVKNIDDNVSIIDIGNRESSNKRIEDSSDIAEKIKEYNIIDKMTHFASSRYIRTGFQSHFMEPLGSTSQGEHQYYSDIFFHAPSLRKYMNALDQEKSQNKTSTEQSISPVDAKIPADSVVSDDKVAAQSKMSEAKSKLEQNNDKKVTSDILSANSQNKTVSGRSETGITEDQNLKKSEVLTEINFKNNYHSVDGELAVNALTCLLKDAGITVNTHSGKPQEETVEQNVIHIHLNEMHYSGYAPKKGDGTKATVQDTPGDGNCLFHAVVMGLSNVTMLSDTAKARLTTSGLELEKLTAEKLSTATKKYLDQHFYDDDFFTQNKKLIEIELMDLSDKSDGVVKHVGKLAEGFGLEMSKDSQPQTRERKTNIVRGENYNFRKNANSNNHIFAETEPVRDVAVTMQHDSLPPPHRSRVQSAINKQIEELQRSK